MPTLRNTPGCKGTGMCQTGCPTGGRTSLDVTYVPRALASGARIHALARAKKVLVRNGRAHGVLADMLDAGSRKPKRQLLVHARKGVIVAGGVVPTPVLLRNSGLKGAVGDNFMAHPGCGVVGRFKERIGLGFGATQGYQVPLFEEGLKIEADRARPGAPAQGPRAPMPHDVQGGRVRGVSGHHGPPQRAQAHRRRAPHRARPRRPRRPPYLHLAGTHLFGTASAGSDPKRSVVNERLEAHDLPGLYVMDASILPTNTGVNPQHTVMALTWRAAERLA
jgi:choline dehydrogenase-like flavoprotein